MNMSMFGRKKGFTLSEIMLAVLISSVFGFSVFLFFNYASTMQLRQNNEVKFQSDMRDTMFIVEEKIRKSNSVFAIHQKDFLNSNGKPKDRKWIYIGVPDVGENAGQLCMFRCTNPEGSGAPIWEETVLSSDKGGVKYKLELRKEGDTGVAQKKLHYKLTGIPENGTERTFSSVTEVLNVVAVVDRGDEMNPCSVIAIRNGSTSAGKIPTLTFVIDISGSMESYLGAKTRMKKTQEVMKRMLNTIYEDGFPIEVSFIRFGNFANVKSFSGKGLWDFGDLDKNYDEVMNIVDGINTSSYVYGQNGWTNIGDGLRLGYESIKRKSQSDKEEKPRYLVLITDGLPNYEIKFKHNWYGSKQMYFGADPVIGETFKFKAGDKTVYVEYGDGEGYAYKIAEKYRPGNPHSTPVVNPGTDPIKGLKSFIISVGNLSDKRVFENINKSMGNSASNYYHASKEADLENAIKRITEEFLTDAWTYTGPSSK